MTRYIETFFRHKVLLVIPLVLTLLLSVWYVKGQPTTYTTSMKSLVRQPAAGARLSRPDRQQRTSNRPATAQTLLGQLLATQDFVVKAAQRGPAAAWIRSQPDPTAAADVVAARSARRCLPLAIGPQVLTCRDDRAVIPSHRRSNSRQSSTNTSTTSRRCEVRARTGDGRLLQAASRCRDRHVAMRRRQHSSRTCRRILSPGPPGHPIRRTTPSPPQSRLSAERCQHGATELHAGRSSLDDRASAGLRRT